MVQNKSELSTSHRPRNVRADGEGDVVPGKERRAKFKGRTTAGSQRQVLTAESFSPRAWDWDAGWREEEGD